MGAEEGRRQSDGDDPAADGFFDVHGGTHAGQWGTVGSAQDNQQAPVASALVNLHEQPVGSLLQVDGDLVLPGIDRSADVVIMHHSPVEPDSHAVVAVDLEQGRLCGIGVEAAERVGDTARFRAGGQQFAVVQQSRGLAEGCFPGNGLVRPSGDAFALRRRDLGFPTLVFEIVGEVAEAGLVVLGDAGVGKRPGDHPDRNRPVLAERE